MKSFVRLLPLVLLALLLIACPETPSPDFSLALNPSTLSFDSINTSKSINLSISKTGGFSSTVTFSVKTVPTGMEATLSNVQADSATVNVKLTQELAAKDYAVTLAGTSGSVKKTIELTVRVGQVSNPNVAVPTGFNASLDGNDKVLLGWEAVENASEYVLERSSDGNSYSSLATASTTNYTDSTVSVNNRYHYRIKAKNASQESAFSDVAVVDIKAVATNEDTVIVVGEQDSKDVALQIPQGFFKNQTLLTLSSNPSNTDTYIETVKLVGNKAIVSLKKSNINPNAEQGMAIEIAVNTQNTNASLLETLAFKDGDRVLVDVTIRAKNANGETYINNYLDIATYQTKNTQTGSQGTIKYLLPVRYPAPHVISSQGSCSEYDLCNVEVQAVINTRSQQNQENPFVTRNKLYRINTELFLDKQVREKISQYCGSHRQATIYDDELTANVAALANAQNIDDSKMPLVLVHGWLALEYIPAFGAAIQEVRQARRNGEDTDQLAFSSSPFHKRKGNRKGKSPYDYFSLTPEVCYWLNFYKYVAMHPSVNKHFDIYAFPYDSVYTRVSRNAQNLGIAIQNVFGNRKIMLIGHSMGGLVSHAYMTNNQDTHKVQRLITLGTPFRGSPMLRCEEVNANGYCLKARINNQFIDTIGQKRDGNPASQAINWAARSFVSHLMDMAINDYPATLDLAWDSPLSGSPVGNQYLRNLNGLDLADPKSRYSDRYTAFYGFADFYFKDAAPAPEVYFTNANAQGSLSSCFNRDIDDLKSYDIMGCGMDFFGNLFLLGHATYDGSKRFRVLTDGIVPMESANATLEPSRRQEDANKPTKYWDPAAALHSIPYDYSNIPDTRFVRLNHIQFMSGRINPQDFIEGSTQFMNPSDTLCKPQNDIYYTAQCNKYFYDLIALMIRSKPNYPPRAALKAKIIAGTFPTKVEFDASESTDDNDEPRETKFLFRFGDSENSYAEGNSPTAYHSYKEAGTYTATVTVTDKEGLSSSASVTITIEASASKPPTADFTFTPAAPVAGQAVSFNAKAHSSDSAVKYGFNFGDGSNSVVNTTGTATHTFAAAGSYNVRLQVEDANGVKSETKVKVVQVQAATSGKVCEGDFVIDGEDTAGDIAKVRDCSEIKGNLQIYNTTLTDLSALSKLQKVTGNMCIGCYVNGPEGNATLTSLAGLENISSIGGYLYINYNAALTSIAGLNKLSSVEGNLYIRSNAALTSLAGLENLSSIRGELDIRSNAALTSLAGLKNLSSIRGGLGIWENAALTSLAGLKNLSSIRGGLGIWENAALTSIAGLNKLSSVEGSLYIYNNDALTSLAGLDNIPSIRGDLYIDYNAALTSIAGLDNISSIGGNVYIEYNAALTSIAGLDNISSIGGNLYIWKNDALTSLAGLENLSSVGGDLYIYNNDALTSLSGLNKLSSVEGYLNISNNDALTSLAGLENLSSIGGYLDILTNTALTSLAGLKNLSSIGGYLTIGANHALTSLSGLDNLSSIGGYLSIHSNAALTSLTGLGNLSSVGGYLRILANAALTSLAGLEKLKEVKGRSKEILNNPKFDCSPYNQNPPPYFPLTKSYGNKVNCTTQ